MNLDVIWLEVGARCVITVLTFPGPDTARRSPQGDNWDGTSTEPLGMARNNRSSRQRRGLLRALECVGVDR